MGTTSKLGSRRQRRNLRQFLVLRNPTGPPPVQLQTSFRDSRSPRSIARMTSYCLADIPTTLTPRSFHPFKFIAPSAIDRPRNLPEPKRKGREWPQTKDLGKLHEMYGGKRSEE